MADPFVSSVSIPMVPGSGQFDDVFLQIKLPSSDLQVSLSSLVANSSWYPAGRHAASERARARMGSLSEYGAILASLTRARHKSAPRSRFSGSRSCRIALL